MHDLAFTGIRCIMCVFLALWPGVRGTTVNIRFQQALAQTSRLDCLHPVSLSSRNYRNVMYTTILRGSVATDS